MADELDIIAFRRALHRRPELSFRETGTHDSSPARSTGWASPTAPSPRTGVLARIEGRGDLRRAVVLRADIDALPIREQADVAWRSLNDGVMRLRRRPHGRADGCLCREFNRSLSDFEGTLLRTLPAGRYSRRAVLAEEPFADYDVPGRDERARQTSLEVGTFGFRAGNHGFRATRLYFTVHGTGATPHCQSIARPRSRRRRTRRRTAQPSTCPERVTLDRPHRGRRRDERRPDDVRLEDAAHLRRGRCACAPSRYDPRHRRLRRPPVRPGQPSTSGGGYPAWSTARLASLARSLAAERWQAVDLPAPRRPRHQVLHAPAILRCSTTGLGVGAASGAACTSTFSPDEAHLHRRLSLYASAGPQTVE